MDTYPEATKVLDSLDTSRVTDYEQYFDALVPRTDEDRFRRGLFALASVHTTWELNCALYAHLWDLSWINDMESLKQKILASRAGLVNNRVKQIAAFTAMFWQFPATFTKQTNEDWYSFRNRVQNLVPGLGPAKSAFYSELNYFQLNRVPCMDTHMFQAYGVPVSDVGKVKPAERARMEMHWDMSCAARKINPVTARWIMWDMKQGKPNSTYWTYVLEKRPEIPGGAQMEMELLVA